MWFLLVLLWLILLLQVRAESLRAAATVYFLQAAAIFGLCALEAFRSGAVEGYRFYWCALGILMVSIVPAGLALSAKRERSVFSEKSRKHAGSLHATTKDRIAYSAERCGPQSSLFAADKVSVAAGFGLGLGYVLLDAFLPFAAGRDYMASGMAFFLAGMGMILLAAGKTVRLTGLCSVGNGLFLTCFLLFGEAPEIMQGMLLVQVIITAVILGMTSRSGTVQVCGIINI